ncbi:transposase [Nocardia sp. NPDC050799]|uniref:IS110 family transposase n=1 Tax=Nocardia sp. NPDC050799 TaxID=3154842 RepID=UPI0034004213
MRTLSTGHGRKTDEADALSVGIAALDSTELQSMRTNATAQVLRTLTEYRGDLIRARTQTANRLHHTPTPAETTFAGRGASATPVLPITGSSTCPTCLSDFEDSL